MTGSDVCKDRLHRQRSLKGKEFCPKILKKKKCYFPHSLAGMLPSHFPRGSGRAGLAGEGALSKIRQLAFWLQINQRSRSEPGVAQAG